jgi:hypothetical protein
MSGSWPGYANVSERTTSASPAAPPAAAASTSPPTTSATPLAAIARALSSFCTRCSEHAQLRRAEGGLKAVRLGAGREEDSQGVRSFV